TILELTSAMLWQMGNFLLCLPAIVKVKVMSQRLVISNSLIAQCGKRQSVSCSPFNSSDTVLIYLIRRAEAHAARARWHPQEAQAAKERAQEIAYLVQQ